MAVKIEEARIGYPMLPRRMRNYTQPMLEKLARFGREVPNSAGRAAVAELAHRFAVSENSRATEGSPYWNRLVDAFMLGFDGGDDPYSGGKGGNWVRPVRRAIRDGRKLRVTVDSMGYTVNSEANSYGVACLDCGEWETACKCEG